LRVLPVRPSVRPSVCSSVRPSCTKTKRCDKTEVGVNFPQGSSSQALCQNSFGVRQGSVLAPFLFAVYIDYIAELFSLERGVMVYADDIILVTSSVCVLQKALEICQRELENLDISINAKKTCCLRIGRRANARCASIVTLNGTLLQWSDELGILVSTLYDLLRSKFLSISLDVRSIVLQTAFLVKLDVSLRKKLRYNCLTVNVFLYCFMDLIEQKFSLRADLVKALV